MEGCELQLGHIFALQRADVTSHLLERHEWACILPDVRLIHLVRHQHQALTGGELDLAHVTGAGYYVSCELAAAQHAPQPETHDFADVVVGKARAGGVAGVDDRHRPHIEALGASVVQLRLQFLDLRRPHAGD